MASPSNNDFSSTSRHRQWRYDVFISFCGIDTGSTFTAHLLEALHKLGVKSNLNESIMNENEQLKAIEESRSLVVVLSEHYASSKSCLPELARIMDKRKTMRQVLPVFYHVNPHDVRRQAGSFKLHFDDHGKKTPAEHIDEVNGWRRAMTEIGNLSGCVVDKRSSISDAEIIKKITRQIIRWLLSKVIASNDDLVDITSKLDHIYELLDLESEKAVQFMGIVGMGGIGKTTLAEVVYSDIVDKFKYSCFLRISQSDTSVASLQNQLLNTISPNRDFDINDDDHGVNEIRRQLQREKVLLVLDGIVDDNQLKMLAASSDWFGPGSRIIITTRFQGLLDDRYQNITTYEMKSLDGEAAFQLFWMHAFGRDDDSGKYLDLAREIVGHARGLPLALKVIGSSLYRRDISIWRETLDRLGHISDKDIIDVLKLSYDALDSESAAPKIFLDIACFFKGKREDRVIEILESFDYEETESNLQLLTKRCLIQVVNGKVLMHNLIQDMGQEIVRRESETQLGRKSRIWLRDDLKDAFHQRAGMEFTEGIVLPLDEKVELKLDAKSFTDMTNLKILEINNVQLLHEDGLTHLSNELRILNWPGFPVKCLPPSFKSRSLFELHMPGSRLERLWVGKKRFDKLKVIDLSKSDNLLVTPDLTAVQNLERLILRECTKLKEIHPSITRLNHLVFLDLKSCISLKSFSSKISCKKLKTLVLSGCSSLESFPEIEEEKMEELAELHLDGTAIEELHPSIGRLTGLLLFNLRECKRLSSLPSEIGKLRSLETLILHGCSSVEQIELSTENAERLRELDISGTSVSQAQLANIHYLRNLKVLHCQGLGRNIWRSLIGCSSGLESLSELNLSNCNLEDGDIPGELHVFSSLEVLDLSGNLFVSLSDDLSRLTKLKNLYLNNCTLLRQLPQLPASFRKVEGRDCFSMTESYYNSEVQMPSEELGVQTLRFPITDENQNFKVVSGLDVFSTKNRVSKQRLLEMFTSDRESYDLSAELDGIFELFDHKEEGTWTEFYYDARSTDNDQKIHAIALVASVRMLQFLPLGKMMACNMLVHMETDESPSKCLLDLEREATFLSGTKVWVIYIPIHMLSKGLINQNSCTIKVSLATTNPIVKVEKCGHSILFPKRITEFMRKLFAGLFFNRSSFDRITKDRNHFSKGTFIEVEDPHEYSSIPSFESDKYSSLKPLLQRTFEETKHSAPFHIFPQRQISSWWFKHQQKQPTLTIKVPFDLHNAKNWMGLALFVVLKVREISANSNRTPHSFNYEIDGDECLLGESAYLPIPEFLLDDSHQVCIIFHPRAAFPYVLNKCDHFHVNFMTHPNVQVVLCGARQVYRQNVEGLMQTIVDCIDRSPEDLHDHFKNRIVENFLITLKSLQASFDSSIFCRFDLLLGTDDKTPPSLQDPFKCKFDRILYGREIPNLFALRVEGNTVEIRLPQRLHCDNNWMGFLVYALVFVNKPTNPSLDPVLGSVKLVDLICKFKVDSDPIEPEHFYIDSEDSFMENESQLFIWLFYIPRSEFRVVWRHSAYFGLSLYTNRPELLSLLQCGLHLVSVKDKKEIESCIE